MTKRERQAQDYADEVVREQYEDCDSQAGLGPTTMQSLAFVILLLASFAVVVPVVLAVIASVR